VLGPLLFLAYVIDIWRNAESSIRLFADDCDIYTKMIWKICGSEEPSGVGFLK
jgi:hypothetical protein